MSLLRSMLVVAALSVISCSQNNAPTGEATTVSHKQDIDALRNQIIELRGKLFTLQMNADRYEAAWFDTTGEKAYQRVDTNVGALLVVLENVEPYLDGHKVTLLIGNPNYMAMSGFKLKATWSKRPPDPTKPNILMEEYQKALTEYEASKQEKEFTLTDTLRAGSWNKIRVTIAPAKSDSFGWLGIKITGNTIMLSGGR